MGAGAGSGENRGMMPNGLPDETRQETERAVDEPVMDAADIVERDAKIRLLNDALTDALVELQLLEPKAA